MNTARHFVSGTLWPGTSDRLGDVYNPATGAVSGRVALASTADVDHAVAAAKAAQPAGARRRRPSAPKSCSPSAAF